MLQQRNRVGEDELEMLGWHRFQEKSMAQVYVARMHQFLLAALRRMLVGGPRQALPMTLLLTLATAAAIPPVASAEPTKLRPRPPRRYAWASPDSLTATSADSCSR